MIDRKSLAQDELDHIMRCAGLAEVLLDQLKIARRLAEQGKLRPDNLEWQAVMHVMAFAESTIRPGQFD